MKKLLLIIAILSTYGVFAQTKWIKVNSGVSGTMITYRLYQKQSDNTYALVKSRDEDSGMWKFDSLASGVYRLHASMAYAKYIPTWHPRKAIWDDAEDIDLTAKDTALCNEGMLPNPSVSGPAAITGILTEGLLKTAGDPLKNVRVVIKDGAGAFVKMTSTNDSGKFSVASLPLGTYKILVDLINIPTANPKTVVLDSTNMNASVDLTVNSTGTVNTGMNGLTGTKTNRLVLYPNPSSDFVTVDTDEIIELSLYDITGVLVVKTQVNRQLPVNVQHLAKGVYFAALTINGTAQVQRFVKQ